MSNNEWQDQRIVDLIAANKIHPPNNEVLANIYRRRGDLAAAATEYDRLHAIGNTAPAVELFRAIFNQRSAPARMPEVDFAPARFVQFDDFFDRASNQNLLDRAISTQAIFTTTELGKASEYGKGHRTNLVTYDMGDFGQAMRALVSERLPLVCERLNMGAIDIKFIHLKIAAYLDGDYFKAHQDNKLNHPDRLISFVYYFHREPKPYTGGDLLLYDSRFDPPAYVRTLYTRVIPRNNSIIFFPSEFFHEVAPVATDSADFGASRFTMAGHIG